MTLPEAVHRLTETWTLVLTPKEAGTYRAQDFPALLDMLQKIVTPNSGRTRGGVNDPATRSVIDTKALDLMMSIEDVVRSRLSVWRVHASKDLTVDVLSFWNRLEALWRSGGVSEVEYANLSRYPQQWATKIWNLVDPPRAIPLSEATCPVCGRAKWENEDGAWVDSLMVSYREGDEVQAECLWSSCTFLATGDRALLELGYHVGATVDVDTLREMGIEV